MKNNPHRTAMRQGAEAVRQFEQKQFTASTTPLQPPDLTAHNSRDETARAFLRLILPESGAYAVFIDDGKRRYNKFATSVEQTWDLIKRADEAGYTAYHACAAYNEARQNPTNARGAERRYGRTKQNARGSKTFQLDVDAGSGKPYADWAAASQAVLAFCTATGLPVPLGVCSGFGLHVYWPLTQTLDRATWERYARGLQALCKKHRLHVDPARTTDIASVLRTPGTHHRKLGVREVRCLNFAGPFQLKVFGILLQHSDQKLAKSFSDPVTKLLGEPPDYIKLKQCGRITEKSLRGLDDVKAYSKQIAENCAQIKNVRDKQGKISEPEWHAALGVLGFCADGEKCAHEWSRGDSRYRPEETQEKLERLRQLTGATTCARFQQLNSNLCDGCGFWGRIKSPIALGRTQDAAELEHVPPRLNREDSRHAKNRRIYRH